MGRNTSFESISKMVKAISMLSRENGANAKELAEAGITDRSNVPDFIAKMEELGKEGFGIAISEFTPAYDKRQTRYKINDISKCNLSLPGLAATTEESILLSLMLNRAKQTPLMKDVSESIEKKLTWLQTIPNLDILSVENIGKKITDSALSNLTFILNAIKNNKSFKITYYSASSDSILDCNVMPVKVFVYDGGIYIRAQIHNEDFMRTFAFERIKGKLSAVKTPKNFTPAPDDADYNDPFGPFSTEYIEAMVKLDASQGWYESQKNWPESVSFEAQADESYIVRIKTHNKLGLIQWILKQGASASIITPESLKEELKAEIKTMLKNYE